MALNIFDIFGNDDDIGPGLSHGAAAFMDAVASNESNGKWNVIYTPKGKVKTFSDYSDHPRVHTTIPKGPHKGKTSSAAGKFQITESTYNRMAKKLGITDFTPASQARIAWELAKEDYKRLTGGDLQAVVDGGDEAAILEAAKTLNGTWTSLPGGIEATHTDESFLKEWRNAVAEGDKLIPKVGLNNELVYDDGTDLPIMGYATVDMGALRGRLPTELKKQTGSAIARHDSIVKEVGKLLDEGIVVPNGTRNLKNTASTVIDFPAADMIAAGVTSMGLRSIAADPNGPLATPSPLTPLDANTSKGRVVAPGVIDVGTGSTSSTSKPVPTSTDSKKKAPVAGLRLPKTPAGQTKPNIERLTATAAVESATKIPSSSAGAAKANTGNPNLDKLIESVLAPTTDKGVYKTTTALAGSNDQPIPQDYKPQIMEEMKRDKAKSTPAPAAINTPLPQPVSLSNPVLKPVAPAPADKSGKTSSTQTKITTPDQSGMPPELKEAVDKVLAEPPKPVVKTTTQTPKPAPGQTYGPAGEAPMSKKPAAEVPQLVPPIPVAKPAPKPAAAPIPKTKPPIPLTKSETIQAQQDANARSMSIDDRRKFGLLEAVGDIVFGGGKQLTGLIGDALSGKGPGSNPDPSAGPSRSAVGSPRSVMTASGPSIAYDQPVGRTGSTTVRTTTPNKTNAPGANYQGVSVGSDGKTRAYNNDTKKWETV